MIGTAVLVALAAVWSFEACAYWLSWWPTITQIVKRYPSLGVVVIAVVALTLVWLVAHFYVARVES